MNNIYRILLVDDEPHSLQSMRMALEDDFEIEIAANADEAAGILREKTIHIIFCDQRMPDKAGVVFLEEVRARWPDIIRIIITGYTEANDMIDAINKAGIYQFVTKPWHPDQLLLIARNAAELYRVVEAHSQLSLEMRYLTSNADKKLKARQRALQSGFGFENIICTPTSTLNEAIKQAQLYAGFDVPVLIQGEISVGKARLARAIHYSSLRAERNFVGFNAIGASPETFARELYGFRRGAIAGTQSGRIGLLQKADRGTLFLENIDRLDMPLQEQLVRVIQSGSFSPIGSGEVSSSNFRLVASTSADLLGLVQKGEFLAELYQTISVGVLEVAPLRNRPDDIALLALHYLHQTAEAHGKPATGFDEFALEFLENYHWPGNMSELQNEITRMLIRANSDCLGAELISRHILQAEQGVAGHDPSIQNEMLLDGTLKERIETIEARILRETLTRLKWNKSRAAAELGLSRVGLRAKLDRYGIETVEKSIIKL